ncbi:MAG: hypothetical protein KDJ52_04730 [Anaerolineae bacterium]|nr:hypothetical protein [Anaerolineae bacterium]
MMNAVVKQMRDINRETFVSTSTIEYALVLVCLILIFFGVFNSALQAQFALIDDHTILTVALSKQPIWETIQYAFTSNIATGGRFKPGHVLTPFIGIALVRTNPKLWHLAMILAGLLTCLFFYASLRNLGLDIISSLFFILLFTIVGAQNSIWYRLLTGETWGILFIAIAVWAGVYAAKTSKSPIWDIVFVAALFLAANFKGSFVLTIPALLLLRWLLPDYHSVHSTRAAGTAILSLPM